MGRVKLLCMWIPGYLASLQKYFWPKGSCIYGCTSLCIPELPQFPCPLPHTLFPFCATSQRLLEYGSIMHKETHILHFHIHSYPYSFVLWLKNGLQSDGLGPSAEMYAGWEYRGLHLPVSVHCQGLLSVIGFTVSDLSVIGPRCSRHCIYIPDSPGHPGLQRAFSVSVVRVRWWIQYMWVSTRWHEGECNNHHLGL